MLKCCLCLPQVDGKGNNNGQYSTFAEERYGTMPTSGHNNYQNGQVGMENPEEIIGGTLNRFVMILIVIALFACESLACYLRALVKRRIACSKIII